jgi:hypothetical protein
MSEDQEGAMEPPAEQPADGTPIVLPHIDFDTPTGDPLVAVRKGYGLMPLHSRRGSAEPAEAADTAR